MYKYCIYYYYIKYKYTSTQKRKVKKQYISFISKRCIRNIMCVNFYSFFVDALSFSVTSYIYYFHFHVCRHSSSKMCWFLCVLCVFFFYLRYSFVSLVLSQRVMFWFFRFIYFFFFSMTEIFVSSSKRVTNDYFFFSPKKRLIKKCVSKHVLPESHPYIISDVGHECLRSFFVQFVAEQSDDLFFLFSCILVLVDTSK